MKNIILFLLAAVMLSFYAEAATNPSADVATDLSPAVREVQQRTIAFASAGYTDAADGLARQNTRQLLAPSPNKIATAAEADVMVDAHLKTELYYAFNTKWRTGKERDHRIVYDFLSQLDKSTCWTRQQREHFTILTVLSLAAQEYFWNEKSTIEDLQDRVRRELRYGSFKEAGHVLNISNAVCLDDVYLERIIRGWVDTNLNAKLESLMAGFKGKGLGRTYAEIVVELDAKFVGTAQSLPFGNLGQDVLSAFDLGGQMPLSQVTSVGDGMCGEHSLFIPTDGACGGISEENGRYKILRAILDNPTDRVARRLYLHNSEHMDGGKFEELIERFIKDLQKQDNAAQQVSDLQAKLDAYQKVKKELEEDKEKKREIQKKELLSTVISLSELRGILGAFNEIVNRQGNIEKLAENKAFRAIVDEIIRIGTNTETGGHTQLKKRLETIKGGLDSFDQQIAFKKIEIENASKAAKENAQKEWWKAHCEKSELIKELAALKALDGASASETEINTLSDKITIKESEATAKYKIYKDIEGPYTSTLNAFKADILNQKYILIINTLKDLIGPDMLLSNSDSFSTDNLSQYGYSNFVNDICQAVCAFVGANTTGECIADLWNGFNHNKDLIEKQIDKQLVLERLAMVESLSVLPEKFAPDALAKEMEAQAKKPGELVGWLPCDSVYTQLWAVLNNFNVFVVSSGEEYGKTPLDLIIRNQQAYDQFSIPYDEGTTGKHLATVILTSPTAKNVFLDKSPDHYNKFIAPGDYGAMARAQRHLEWGKLSTRYNRYPEPMKGG